MNIGYSYWGFLADIKMDKDGNELSTPDGNAFYSWAIIQGLQHAGAEVYQIMPDRDRHAFHRQSVRNMFRRFCCLERATAYMKMHKHMYDGIDDWSDVTRDQLYDIWLRNGIDKLDAILHEWRMLIPGRNDVRGKDFQPDYFIQEVLIEFCAEYNIKLILFDLDYKLSIEDIRKMPRLGDNVYVLELGYKWKDWPQAYHVEIPFDYNELCAGSKLLRCSEVKTNYKTDLVYIGNRYERDDYIDKYIPSGTDLDIMFYGNWLLDGYNDCVEKWPHINFGQRLQASEIGNVYEKSVCTILLAKDVYYENGFMTARLLEALYYGCLPLFPVDYGREIIEKYAGTNADLLTVRNSREVAEKVQFFRKNVSLRNSIIRDLRYGLKFMDKSFIASRILEIAGEGNEV